jgi:hypothetical protein
MLELIPFGQRDIPFYVDNLRDTYVKRSAVHGFGLYADRALTAGERLGSLDGQFVDRSSFDRMVSREPFPGFGGYLFEEWNAISADRLLVRPFRSKYGFINHAREPNLVIAREGGSLYIDVLADVRAGAELFLDYRAESLGDAYRRRHDFL